MWLPGHFCELAELAVVAHGKNEVAVRRREVLVGHYIRVRVAQAPRRVACGQVIHGLVSQAGYLYIEQRHVDMLAHPGLLPMGKGSKHGYR
ncbi:hypothetical protein D3C81_1937730 [compost metagenome]